MAAGATNNMGNKAAAGEKRPAGPGPNTAYGFLSSVKLAIALLSLIALACIVGTLIPQAALVEYGRRHGEGMYAFLRASGLTDVFHAPWFFGLLSLFVLNLVLCTLKRLGGLFKGGDRSLPTDKKLAAMPLHFFVKGAKIDGVEAIFRGYRSRREGNGAILEKGGLSRYGVYIIHASIVAILLGGLIGLLLGFRGSLALGKGEAKDAAVKRDGRTAIPLGFSVKLDDFSLTLYPGGEPKEYLSRIEIIDNGRTVARADVRVNHPVSYKGTNIYQASYGQDPIFVFDIAGREVRLNQGGVYKQGDFAMMAMRFERSVHDFGPGVQVAYIEGGETRTAWFMRDVPRLAAKTLAGAEVRLKGIDSEYYSGLEVARDPGVWVVWTGFALILIGLYINFFMHFRRIYLLQTAEGVLVAGTSPRNREAFKEEFEKWRKKAHGLER